MTSNQYLDPRLAQYFDPRNDVVFKKIFYNHSDLLINFLNALIPLPEDREIESVENIPMELMPETPLKDHSSFDVLCTDNYGMQFIVEISMLWHTYYDIWINTDASKVYFRKPATLQDSKFPVYSLGLLTNEIYDKNTPEFYHHYKTVNIKDSNKVFNGLQFIMIELEKFNPATMADRKMAVLWLRFFTEVRENTLTVSNDLLEDSTIRRAIKICQHYAYTPAELYVYDKYWDIVSCEKTALGAKFREGKEIGIEIGKEKERIQLIIKNRKAGLSVEIIANFIGLTPEQVSEILKQHQDELGIKN
jgi:hypothetical protein